MVQGGRGPWIMALLLAAALAALFSGCASTRESKPIIPVSEYERLIAGRMDADYVGDRACLARCHEHDRFKEWFDASTMGAQLSPESGLPLVNCESCHGPGSLAVKGIKMVNGKLACDYKTFIDFKALPKQAQSLICLKCHSANATFNLHNWNAGEHNMSGVSCFDCHNVHRGPSLKVHPAEVSALCGKCHENVMAEFKLPNHHPLAEGGIYCTECHDPHGTDTEKLLREATVKELCTNCHSEKEGPFVYEHADLTEDCRNCHVPHGSVNKNLLTVKLPFLCKQCHEQHRIRNVADPTSIARKERFFIRCTDCHSQIHGSDNPSFSGNGTFIQ